MAKWIVVKSTLYAVQCPKPKQLVQILLKAIKPRELKERVEDRMWSGLGPEEIPRGRVPPKPKQWRLRVRKNPSELRRENANYMDLMGEVPKSSSKSKSKKS